VIRPVARRQPREAAAGIRVHTRLPEGCSQPVQVRCLIILSSPLNPTAPDSHMQTPKQTATTQERQQGTNPIAVLFQQQSAPPSIQMAPRELTEPGQFYSVCSLCIPSVCKTEGALRIWMRLLPAYNPLDVCQRSDRYEIMLCCTSKQVHCLKEVVPWKLSGTSSAFIYTHPTRETATTKPAPQD